MSVGRQRTEELYAAFAKVETNGQAIAFARSAIGAAGATRARFSALSLDGSHREAVRRLNDVADDVDRSAKAMQGDPGMRVQAASWDDLKHAIGRLYSALWAIQDVLAGEDDSLIGFAQEIGGYVSASIKAVPTVVSTTVGYAAGLVGGAAKQIAGGLVPLWPIVAVVAVVAVGGFVLLRVVEKGAVA